MRLSLDRRGPTSLTDQLKAQIRHLIASGRLGTGTRVPPVRTLAAFLRINRNTVGRAYAELQAEGMLEARAGGGTRVAWAPPRSRASQALSAQIDRLLATASDAGVHVDELIATLAVRAAHRRSPERPRIGFVECNQADLAYFARLVRTSVDVPVTGILLSDLPRRPDGVDLLATTFFHIEEVRRRCPGIEVVGLMALPDFQTLEEVARLPKSARVALVCATVEGVRSKARSLQAVGLRTPRLETATLDDPAALPQVLGRADVLIAAPRVIDRIRGTIPARVQVVPFASFLSDGAVALLHERIAAWRSRHTRDGMPWGRRMAPKIPA